MQNNIFVKNNKNKFNPDIEDKFKSKETERECIKFNLSNSIYNPITGVIPSKINSIKDLSLEKDISFDKINIQKLISDKNTERINEDNIYKPIKTKIINNPDPNPNPKLNYIETFEDMKNGSSKNNKTLQPQISNDKYDNILDGLKDLGIFK